MFVRRVDIKEFRGIKSCDKPLEFSNFTVLVGRNNSGKTSVLEALSLLPLPNHNLPYHNDSRVNLLSNLHAGSSSLIYGYSGIASINYKIHPRKKGRLLTWRITLRPRGDANLFIEGMDQEKIRSDPTTVAEAMGLQVKRRGPGFEKVLSRVLFFPSRTTFMDGLLSRLHDEPNRYLVTKFGAHTRVAKNLISECVDDVYTELFFGPELSGRKELPDGNVLYIKIKDLGAGIEKVALFALWLEALRPDLVLWDDFEGSAHPTLIKILLKWLSKKQWQVILSTHSIDVLSSLLDVRPENAKVIQLKKTDGDILFHKDLDLEDLENLIEANQDPRMLVDLLGL